MSTPSLPAFRALKSVRRPPTHKFYNNRLLFEFNVLASFLCMRSIRQSDTERELLCVASSPLNLQEGSRLAKYHCIAISLDGMFRLTWGDQSLFLCLGEDGHTGRAIVLSAATHMEYVVKSVPGSGIDASSDSGVKGVAMLRPPEFKATFLTSFSIGGITRSLVILPAEKKSGALEVAYGRLSSILKQVARPENSMDETKTPMTKVTITTIMQLRHLSDQGIFPSNVKLDDELALWRGVRICMHDGVAEVYIVWLQKEHHAIAHTFSDKGVVFCDGVLQSVDSFLRHSQPITDTQSCEVSEPPNAEQEACARRVFTKEFCDYISSNSIGGRSMLWSVLLLLSYDLHRISLCIVDNTRTIPCGLFAGWMDDLVHRWCRTVLIDGPLCTFIRRCARSRYINCLYHARAAFTRKLQELSRGQDITRNVSLTVAADRRIAELPRLPLQTEKPADSVLPSVGYGEPPSSAQSPPAAGNDIPEVATSVGIAGSVTENPSTGLDLAQVADELRERKLGESEVKERIIALINLQFADILNAPSIPALSVLKADLLNSLSKVFPAARAYLLNGPLERNDIILTCVVFRVRKLFSNGTSSHESVNRIVRDELFNHMRVKDPGAPIGKTVGSPLDVLATEASLSNTLHRRNMARLQRDGGTAAAKRRFRDISKGAWIAASLILGVNGANVTMTEGQLPFDLRVRLNFKGTSRIHEEYRKRNTNCDSNDSALGEIASMVDTELPKLDVSNCPSHTAAEYLTTRRLRFAKRMSEEASRVQFDIDLARGTCPCEKPACAHQLGLLLYARFKKLHWRESVMNDDHETSYVIGERVVKILLDWQAKVGTKVEFRNLRSALLINSQTARAAVAARGRGGGCNTASTANGAPRTTKRLVVMASKFKRMGYVAYTKVNSASNLEEIIASHGGRGRGISAIPGVHILGTPVLSGRKRRAHSGNSVPSILPSKSQGVGVGRGRGGRGRGAIRLPATSTRDDPTTGDKRHFRSRSASAASLVVRGSGRGCRGEPLRLGSISGPTCIIAIDIETTGLQPCATVELGAVIISSGLTFSRRIKPRPGFRITGDATEIHHISNDDVDNEPGFDIVWPAFLVWVQSNSPSAAQVVLLSYNGFAFDFNTMYADCLEFKMAIPEAWLFADLYSHVRRFKGFAALPSAFYASIPVKGQHTQNAVYCRVLGRDILNMHSALGDATALAELYSTAMQEPGFELTVRMHRDHFNAVVDSPSPSLGECCIYIDIGA